MASQPLKRDKFGGGRGGVKLDGFCGFSCFASSGHAHMLLPASGVDAPSRFHKLRLVCPEAFLFVLQVLHVLVDPVPDPQHGSCYFQSPRCHFTQSGCRKCSHGQLSHSCCHSGWLCCPQRRCTGMVDLVRLINLLLVFLKCPGVTNRNARCTNSRCMCYCTWFQMELPGGLSGICIASSHFSHVLTVTHNRPTRVLVSAICPRYMAFTWLKTCVVCAGSTG